MSQVKIQKKPKLSIVIPAYNEEEGIGGVLKELVPLAEKENWEIVIVDDFSSDKTVEVVEDFTKKYKYIHLVKNVYNKGYGGALKAGIGASNSDIIVTIDADGQHNPCDIEKVAANAEKDRMIVGMRDKESYQVHTRRPGKRILTWIACFLVGQDIPDLNSGLRAFHKKNYKEFSHLLPN